jgi:hypothetical protein
VECIGQLNYFIVYDDKTPHEMFNRLKKLVYKARALGFKKWIDRMLMKRLMMTYTLMNYNIVALIRQDPVYKKMSSDDVLGRIMNHEMNIQEAKQHQESLQGRLNLQETRYCSQSKKEQNEESFD